MAKDSFVLINIVNGARMPTPLLIYGTPKLEYPYEDFETQEYKDFSKLNPPCATYIIANKWNG